MIDLFFKSCLIAVVVSASVSAADTITSNPGKAVARLAELSRSHSKVFQLSDPDRPGAWCWFQDPRAIVDSSNPQKPVLLTGVVTYGEPGS